MFTRNESHWVASLTTRKKPPTLIFSLLFAKITTPNAAEIPKRVLVVKRYRVYRRSGKIEQWEAASDTWHAYKGAQTK